MQPQQVSSGDGEAAGDGRPHETRTAMTNIIFIAGFIAALFAALAYLPFGVLTWLWVAIQGPHQLIQADYQFNLPPQGIEVKAGEYVEFVASSRDVTYGFGVFRPDGTMVFQMQVLPGYQNRMVWRFDAPGTYDVRSTEYSGPRHSAMFVAGGLRVVP